MPSNLENTFLNFVDQEALRPFILKIVSKSHWDIQNHF